MKLAVTTRRRVSLLTVWLGLRVWLVPEAGETPCSAATEDSLLMCPPKSLGLHSTQRCCTRVCVSGATVKGVLIEIFEVDHAGPVISMRDASVALVALKLHSTPLHCRRSLTSPPLHSTPLSLFEESSASMGNGSIDATAQVRPPGDCGSTLKTPKGRRVELKPAGCERGLSSSPRDMRERRAQARGT